MQLSYNMFDPFRIGWCVVCSGRGITSTCVRAWTELRIGELQGLRFSTPSVFYSARASAFSTYADVIEELFFSVLRFRQVPWDVHTGSVMVTWGRDGTI